MADELRWILLGLSVVLLAGIWWWGARRSRQAPGNAALREFSLAPTLNSLSGAAASAPPAPAPAAPAASQDAHLPPAAARAAEAEPREWGVPPFEPLSIRTADFDELQFEAMSMTALSEPVDALPDAVSPAATSDAVPLPSATDPAPDGFDADPEPVLAPAPRAAAPTPTAVAATTAAPARIEPTGIAESAASPGAAPSATAAGPNATGVSNAAPNVSEAQRIVTLRVCAQGESRWPGAELLAALEDRGLSFGRYRVFHRMHSDGRTLFCAASLIEPGSFDTATMAQDEFRGLTLFAVLPGPADPVQTVDALIATAGELAYLLQGTVQDSKGTPLSAQSAAALRADVAHFQSLLTMQ